MLSFQGRATRLLVAIAVVVLWLSLNVDCILRKGGNTVKLKKGDTNGGYGLNYSPPNYSSVVIWLHGLCGSAIDWERFVLLVDKKGFLPNTKWILPTSKFRKITAIYNNKCPAWFDITSFSPSENVEDVDGILESARRIRGMIMSEIESGIDQSKIFLVGFSQGSAMALISSLIMRDITLGGVIGVSGWIPMIDHLLLGSESPFNDEDFDFSMGGDKKTKTNVFIFHGSKDNVIPFSVFLQTMVFMNIELGIRNINQRVYYDIGHTITALQGIHIMYEISRMVDPGHIHDVLAAVKNSTLSNNSYSMILKVSNPTCNDNMHYKFIPCDPNKDGEISCSINNCKCTSKLTFYEESKFFDNLKNRNFGQFINPYAILQAVPSERTLKSKSASYSSNTDRDKKNNQSSSELVTLDLDSDGNTIPNLFTNSYNKRIIKNQDEHSEEMRIFNKSVNDSLPLSNQTDIAYGSSNHTSENNTNSRLKHSSLSSSSKDNPESDFSTKTNQTIAVNKYVSFRKPVISHGMLNRRLFMYAINNHNDTLDKLPSTTSFHSEIHIFPNGNYNNTEEEQQEQNNDSDEQGEDHHPKQEEKNETDTNIGTDIDIEEAQNIEQGNITGKIISNKISHYIKAPILVRHYQLLSDDESHQQGDNVTRVEGGGTANFSIPQYIKLMSNQSKYYNRNESYEVTKEGDE